MPIYIPASALPDAPPPPQLPVPIDTADGLPHATWYAPDGAVWPLTDPRRPVLTPNAVAGLGAAPIQIATDPSPRGGVTVRHIHPQARYITWPLLVTGRTHADFVTRWRSLVTAFTQTRRLGPGRLRITRPDGTAREIDAYYQAGLDVPAGHGWHHATAALTLLCPDPYWRDITVHVEKRVHTGDGGDFYDPFFTLSPGRVLGETTITNPGDVEAWPTWKITGPAELVTATNHTTGEQFVVDPTWDGDPPLGNGETVTITTDPPTVRGPAGQVWTGALNWPDAVLWGLVPGENHVEFQVAGADEGTTVELSWQTRHETA